MALSVASFTEVASGWFDATTPRSITGVAWSSGDYIVVIGIGQTAIGAIGLPTNANLTFSQDAVENSGVGNECEIYVWHAVAANAQTAQSIAATKASGSMWGMAAWVITGGPTSVANAAANLTESDFSKTVQAGSIVIFGLGDWNSTNPPGKTPGTGSGSATERRDQGDGLNYAQYLCEWVGTAAGTFSFGPNNYTSLQVAKIMIEIRGPATSGAATTPGVFPLAVPPGANLSPGQLRSWRLAQSSAIEAVDFTVSCSVPVGVTTTAGATFAPSASSTVPIGVATRSTPVVEPSAVSTVPTGVATRAGAVVEPVAASSVPVGVATRAGALAEFTRDTAAFIGVTSRAGAVPEPAAATVAPVGVASRSTVTVEPSAITISLVGVQARSTVVPEPSAVTRGYVGVQPRTGASIDITAGSSTFAGLLAVAQPQAGSDVIVASAVYIGAATRAGVSVEPTAAAVAPVGLATRSTATVTATAASVALVGVQARSQPVTQVTAVTVAPVGALPAAAATVSVSTATQVLVGLITQAGLTVIAAIFVERIDTYREPAGVSYTEPATARWREPPTVDGRESAVPGWREPQPWNGRST